MWLRAVALSWQARQHQITHLHAHFGSLPASVALGMAQLLDVSFSFSVHGRDVHVPDSTLAAKTAQAYFVLACSQHIRERLARSAPEEADRLILHYHGLPVDQDQVEPLEPSQPPLILGVGRLIAKKGFTHLIDACALLKARGISFRAQIIGDGPQRALLAARIADHGLSEQITLYGACSTAEVWGWYRQSHMLVVPSCIATDGDQDGIPNVILEALACSRPVIASAVGGIPEVIHDQDTGLLVPPASPDALADAIVSLLDDSASARRLAQHGRALVEQEFSLSASSRRLARIFRAKQQSWDEHRRQTALLQAHE
jgi:colanic acid/amylovoran biosynthesis glycosyltransferase